MQRYFFRSTVPAHVRVVSDPGYCIQIPSLKDASRMQGMPAGGGEDQAKRLTNMAQHISHLCSQYISLPVITTDQVVLPLPWRQLFLAINQGNKADISRFLNDIPKEDVILQALLAVHNQEYIQQIIFSSLLAKTNGMKQLNNDILITPGTFEVLIKDIATTLLNGKKVHFSFGLPTHHAFSDAGSGFCVFNKTALMMKHAEHTHKESLKYIVIGTDVNRDNGLCEILRESFAHADICHVDIFDSRVYPKQGFSSIAKEFHQKGEDAGQKIKYWSQENLEYYAIDLSVTTRKTDLIHPALIFALQKVEEHLEYAKISGRKTVLFLPTGWDSHEEETAYCGKYINGKMMGQAEAKFTRFNDEDLSYFYERIFALFQENKEFIDGMYWGLEGGYEPQMYERQIELLMQHITKQFQHHNDHQMMP